MMYFMVESSLIHIQYCAKYVEPDPLRRFDGSVDFYAFFDACKVQSNSCSIFEEYAAFDVS